MINGSESSVEGRAAVGRSGRPDILGVPERGFLVLGRYVFVPSAELELEGDEAVLYQVPAKFTWSCISIYP